MKNEWEEKLRHFPQVWDRVSAAAADRALPRPAPQPPLKPGKGCCTRAVRFQPRCQ